MIDSKISMDASNAYAMEILTSVKICKINALVLPVIQCTSSKKGLDNALHAADVKKDTEINQM